MSGWHRRTVTAVAAVMVTVALPTCAKEPEPVRLSPLPSTPSAAASSATPTPTGTQGLSDREQIKAINVAFTEHYRKAQDLPKADRKRYLTRWMTDSAAERLADTITDQRARHLRSTGRYVSNVMSVTIKGDEATVRDCIDQSGFSMRDERTGKQLGEDLDDHFLSENLLVRTTAGWRMHSTKDLKRTCVPPS